MAPGTPVVIVGQISSQPRDAGIVVEEKMQVAVGPQRTDYTLHLSDARMRDAAGQEIAKSALKDKWWVRATGTIMDDPRRIKVTDLQVLGHDDAAFRRSAHYRPETAHGSVQAVAGARQELSARLYPEGTSVVIVGEISSQPRDAGVVVEEKMQVAVGPQRTDYTLHLSDARMRDAAGQEIAKSGLQDKWWVRATGTIMDDARRIKVMDLQVLGTDWNAYRGSPHFRQDQVSGYIIARQAR
jgi:hypothetical protein